MGEPPRRPVRDDGRKRYRFTVCWGRERDTDGHEAGSPRPAIQPSAEAIRELLPRLPADRADPTAIFRIKIQGGAPTTWRADGETVELKASRLRYFH